MSSAPVRVGEELTVRVDALGDGPDGLCRVGKYVLFVPGVLPGEVVRIRVRSAGRKFGRGELLGIDERSPDRVDPLCEHFGRCGGCDLQHLRYSAQLQVKTERLRKTLAHALGREVPELAPMQGPTDPWGQRTKIVLMTQTQRGRLIGGLMARGTRELVEIRECPVSEPKGFATALAALDVAARLGWEGWAPLTDHGTLRAVVVRADPVSGTSQLGYVVRRPPPRAAEIVPGFGARLPAGIAVHENDGPAERLLGRDTRLLHGEERLACTLGGVRYLCSPGAFFQTSHWGAGFLVEAVRRLVAPPPDATILDLYCGGGLLAMALADRVQEVVGVEENPRAARDAQASAEANHFVNFRMLRGPVEVHLRKLPPRPHAVLLDPPRDGAAPEVLRAIAGLQPKKIFYVSCAPEALACDLIGLGAAGYAPTTIEPFDMFPMTHHVEAVVLLEKTELDARRRLLARARGS